MASIVVSYGWDAYVVTERMHTCFMCGGPTNSIHMDFEGPLHTGTCTADAWRDFEDAWRGHQDDTAPAY